MKKISVRNLLILIFFSQAVLIMILISKTYFGAQVRNTTLKSIKYLTVYKDFSELNLLPASYSYSSLVYTKDTEAILLNTGEVIREPYKRDDGKLVKIELKNSDKTPKKLLLTNCAFDNSGRTLDVILTLSDYNAFDPNDDEASAKLSLFNVILYESNQVHPICDIVNDQPNSNPTTMITHPIQVGDPIMLDLYTIRSQVKFTINYYVHPQSYTWTNQGNYKIDISKMEVAHTVTNVNGIYTDIDVVHFPWTRYILYFYRR